MDTSVCQEFSREAGLNGRKENISGGNKIPLLCDVVYLVSLFSVLMSIFSQFKMASE